MNNLLLKIFSLSAHQLFIILFIIAVVGCGDNNNSNEESGDAVDEFADGDTDQPSVELDTTPDAFTLEAVQDAPVDSEVSSNTVIISGITAPVSITVSNGSYSINDSKTFTSNVGTINNNDTLTVRVATPKKYESSVTATVTVGEASANFEVTTQAEPARAAPSLLAVSDSDTGGITVQDAVDELLGLGNSATVSNISFTGDPRCMGLFSGGSGLGAGALGFDAGVILGSGRAIDAAGPNSSDETSGEFITPGDDFLDSLVPGDGTFDACVIEFDFECEGADTVSVDYVMGSEEYNEFVEPDGANDVFGFSLNGNNIATIPTSGGVPVSIANLNCGNPYNPSAPTSPNPPFCDFFINNDLQDGGGDIDIEADGITTLLTAEGSLLSGVNHIKFAVGDTLDEAFDTWVFLKQGSFRCDIPDEPELKTFTLLSTTGKSAQGSKVFKNEDIIKFDPETGSYEKFFDGSDVGLGGANVDAFAVSASGDLFLSVDNDRRCSIKGLPKVANEDILRFVPTSLGVMTRGKFEILFNGSKHGLRDYKHHDVDIDAFHIDEGKTSGPGNDDDSDGIANELDKCPLDALNDIDDDGLCGNFKLYISLSSKTKVHGSWYSDEDIILFNEATDSFSKYFNGSEVGLRETDVDAIYLQEDGSILMSFKGSIHLPGIGKVRDEDVVRFIPTSLGQNTAGSFELFHDGSETNIKGKSLDFNSIAQIME